MHLLKKVGVLFFASLIFSSAKEVEISGSIATELRSFFEEPQFDGQLEHFQPSLIVHPEFYLESENGDHQFFFSPFLRIDFEDDERLHADIRELNWLYIADDWELRLGIGKVFWGVTESRHLVDVINQDDFVEDIDGEDKLGQQMLKLSFIKDWGTWSFFVLPGFRERTFPGVDGRLRSALPVDTDKPIYASSAEEWHTDFAMRYFHSIGSWDIGAHYFYGTAREPQFFLNANETRLLPHYALIHQGGLDIQYTKEAWLWKFEGLIREGQGKTFLATVTGFEYTFYQLFESNADLGVLLEHLYDDRDDSAPPTAFQKDLFVGSRLALNDPQDSQLLLGGILDLEESSAALFLEAERRLGENWKLELEARLFTQAEKDPALTNFQDDSFLTLRLSRFF